MALTMNPPVKPGELLMGERPDTERWTSEQRAAKALLEFKAKLDAVMKPSREERRHHVEEPERARGGAVHAARAEGGLYGTARRRDSQQHRRLRTSASIHTISCITQ
ncbi:hypothetical protein ZWY2020_012232 [Hordeum vulgare]|nr:hypothetical protein ZWY2020_012232 [Hordeum vulgare]